MSVPPAQPSRGAGLNLKVLAVVIVILVALGASFYLFDPFASKPPSIIIFSADAYVAESSYLASGFANSTGAAYIAPTGAGSLVLAQQIRAGSPVSVFISVSRPAVTSTYLGDRSSGWAIAFGADQMVLAYANSTARSAQVSAVVDSYSTASASNATADWRAFFNAVSSGNVRVGIANPNADPAGYRGWLVLEAAGYTYGGADTTYFSSQMISSRGNFTGASAAALVAPLQTGNIDFLFIYKSAAISHHLAYFSLPRQVNLGDSRLGTYYSRFTYAITSGVQKGAAILLFVTVPKNSTATDQAMAFVVYLVSHATTLSSFGVQVISPPKLYNSTAVPGQIQQLASDGSVTLGGSL